MVVVGEAGEVFLGDLFSWERGSVFGPKNFLGHLFSQFFFDPKFYHLKLFVLGCFKITAEQTVLSA